MSVYRGISGQYLDASRHAEMKDEGSALESDNQIFRAPFERQNTSPGQLGGHLGGHRPAQVRISNLNALNRPSEDVAAQSPAGGFDLR